MDYMSRRRYISTEISIDRAVNQMGTKYGDFPVLLYTWMIPHALDDATLTGDPYEILNMVLPGRRDKSEDDIVNALRVMVEFGLVEWTNSKVLFHPDSFYRYQTYIKKENRRTAHNGEEYRITTSVSEDQRTSLQKAVSLSLSHSHSHSHSKDDDDLGQATSDIYERIEAIMQQKLVKPNFTLVKSGYQELKKLLADGYSESEIVDGIDFAFDHYDPQSFQYCANVIRSLRETESAKREIIAGGERIGTNRSQGARHPEENAGAEVFIQQKIDRNRDRMPDLP